MVCVFIKAMSQTHTQVVILDSSSNEDIFVCGMCKFVFNSLHLFINHKNFDCLRQQNLHNNNILQSSVPTSNPYDNVTAPTLRERNKKPVCDADSRINDISCTVCKRKFKRLKCLYAHLKLHEKPSQCPVCGRCFEDASHLKRHIATHRVWPDGLNETTPKSLDVELLSYSCSYCDVVLANYSQFRAHLSHHLLLKKFKCIQGECTGFYETVEDLLDHVSDNHSTIKYTCHICRQVFHSLSEIAVHYEAHNVSLEETKSSQIQHFKCSQCDATFRKPEKLSLHLLTENHNKACIHCKKCFASEKRLRMHLQIHKKSKPFQCEVCNSSFHMKKYLTSHMSKHGERRFICTVCKHSFKRQDVLQRHMRTHTQRKIFKCPFKDVNNCCKEFNRKDKLNQHLKSHTRHKKPSNRKTKTSENKDTEILEICIVPLDSNDSIKNDKL